MFREEIEINFTLKRFKKIFNYSKPKKELIRNMTKIITDLLGLRFLHLNLKEG